MMSKSGTMLSLMAFTIAMLVQDTFQLPTTPPALVEYNAYETVPAELNLTNWNLQDPAQAKKLQELGLFEFNKIREINGVIQKLTTKEEISKLAFEQADTVCADLAKSRGKDFDIRNSVQNYDGFKRLTSIGASEINSPVIPSDVVVTAMNQWYNLWSEKVQKGMMKDMIQTFNSATQYAGFGVSKLLGPDEHNNTVSYYAIVVDLGTERQFNQFTDYLKNKKD